MSEVAKASPKEQTELTELLSEVRQIETKLRTLTGNIEQAFQATWHDLLNLSIQADQRVLNLNQLISLGDDVRKLYLKLEKLNDQIISGNINSDEESEIQVEAKDRLPSIIENLLTKVCQIRMDMLTSLGELRKVSCPARLIRDRIAKIIQVPTTDTDDFILNRTTE